MVTILSSMYGNVRNCVRLISNILEFFDVSLDYLFLTPNSRSVYRAGVSLNIHSFTLGVEQGEPLSPILFISFVNDMHKEMSEQIYAVRILNEICIFMLMYADYPVLFANSESELQKMLDNLSVHCDKWKIDVNTSKIKIYIYLKEKEITL